MIKIVAQKIGMVSKYFDGILQPCTLVKIYSCYVLEVIENDNNNTLVLGYDILGKKTNKISKSVLGTYKARNITPCRRMKSVKVSKNSAFKVGELINIKSLEKFLIKDLRVDVTGISKGKGFAGVMKRHNFAGLEATHGVSVSHRSHGSTGQCQDPGRVLKGKKMAGHMGSEQVTVKNLTVLDFDIDEEFICIRGSIPGAKQSNIVLNLDVNLNNQEVNNAN